METIATPSPAPLPASPTALEAWSLTALDRLVQGEAAAVLAEAESWCATHPTAGCAHRVRALALLQQNRASEAEAACLPALADPTTQAQGLATLAIVHGAQGALGMACRLLEASIALIPDLAEFHFNLARVLSALDQGTAAEVLERVFILKPEYSRWPTDAPHPLTRLDRMGEMARDLRAELLRRNGQPGRALQLWEQAGPLRQPTAWLHKGHALADLGHYSEALACYAAVPATAPEAAEARWSRQVLALHGAPVDVQGKPPALVRIFVCRHQPGPVLETPPFVPIQAGRAISRHRLPGLGDDQGDHISNRNPVYSELTAHYWLWHNGLGDPDFTHIGLCHYRRYPWFGIGPGLIAAQLTRLQAITLPTLAHALAARHDMLLPTPLILPLPVRQHWQRFGLPPATLDAALALVARRHPAMVPTVNQVMDGRLLYTGNILIMPKAEFAACMAWLFGLLFAVEARERLQPEGIPSRVYGHLAERLLTIYVRFRHEQEGASLAHFPVVLAL